MKYLVNKAGNLIPDLDLLIASTALEQNLTLITRNLRHYERVRDLALYRANKIPVVSHLASISDMYYMFATCLGFPDTTRQLP